jgi:endonuclease/exonuclease/phosphatase family metal-dependent hydrolase
VRIDHVLGSDGGGAVVRALRTRIAAGPVSDHRALIADLDTARG